MKNKQVEKNFFYFDNFSFFKGLELLPDILRLKDNRRPTIILKALSINSKDTIKSRSILAELRDKSEPSKKIIVAISQKSLDQFLLDV